MTRSRRSSRSLELAALLAGLTGLAGAERVAHAQACCVGTGLVTPARLRAYEHHAVGLQTRVRSLTGSFDPAGNYQRSSGDDAEMDFEQDLLGVVRFGSGAQVGFNLPFVETSRRVAGASSWGGGLGDVSVNLRYDFLLAAERPRWPGIALLAAVTFPTGRPVDQAGDPLATSATGTGSYQGSVGVAVESIVGQAFFSASGWIAQRTSRTVGPVTQSFAPQLSALLVAGYAFRHEVTAGAFALGTRTGDARDQNGVIPQSGSGTVTAGLAIAVSIHGEWRLQGTVFGEPPVGGMGRNQGAGLGGSAALLRTWM